jgi:hypothetical protein
VCGKTLHPDDRPQALDPDCRREVLDLLGRL